MDPRKLQNVRCVLIVQPEGILRALLVERFERAGFTVRAVASPALALGDVQRCSPDLIVCDLDADGPAVQRSEVLHIRQAAPLTELQNLGAPIIYLASRGGEMPFPTLRKPFRPAQLLSLARLSLQL